MNNETIGVALSKYLPFKGVFSLDQWRSIPVDFPAGYVFNTQPQHVEFGHWVAIFIDEFKQGVFFDTFGRPPERLGFHPFLAKHSISHVYNPKAVQNPLTVTCGQHVVVFLLNGKNVHKWFTLMGSNTLGNDNFVYNYVSRTFNINPPFYPTIDHLIN